MALTIYEVVEFLIANGPGRTARELSEAIFGADGYQQRVNSHCEMLVGLGKAERRGEGGYFEPFRYYPAKVDA